MSHSFSDVRFRLVIPSDIDQLREIYQECFPVTYPDAWFEDLITNTELIAFVAEVKNHLVGILVAKLLRLQQCNGEDCLILDECFPPDSCVAYILSLGVSTKFRSMGVASQLLSGFMYYVSGSFYIARHQRHMGDASPKSVWLNGSKYEHSSYNESVIVPNFQCDRRLIHTAESYASMLDLLSILPPLPPVCYAVYLHVLSTNRVARRFYENRGFHMLHIRYGCYTIDGVRKDGYTYVRHLNGGFGHIQTQRSFDSAPGKPLPRWRPNNWIPTPVTWFVDSMSRLGSHLFHRLVHQT